MSYRSVFDDKMSRAGQPDEWRLSGLGTEESSTDNPARAKLEPCVQYFLVYAHEEIAQGLRQCQKDNPKEEKGPHLCLASCINQVNDSLKCRTLYPTLFTDDILKTKGSCDAEEFLKRGA